MSEHWATHSHTRFLRSSWVIVKQELVHPEGRRRELTLQTTCWAPKAENDRSTFQTPTPPEIVCPSGQGERMEKCPTQWKIMLSVVSPRVRRFGKEEAADLEKRDE